MNLKSEGNDELQDTEGAEQVLLSIWQSRFVKLSVYLVGYIPSNSTYLSTLFPKLNGRLKHPFDFILHIIDRIVSLSIVITALYVVFNIPQGNWACSTLTAQGLKPLSNLGFKRVRLNFPNILFR